MPVRTCTNADSDLRHHGTFAVSLFMNLDGMKQMSPTLAVRRKRATRALSKKMSENGKKRAR
jgi:hypothetical protein